MARCITVEYWSERWANNDSSVWHNNYIHPCLERHYQKLLPQEGKVPSSKPRIFVPLCGKTLDMIWLAEKGFQVVGVEAVEQAILEFFKDNNVAYDVKTLDTEGIRCYSSLDESKDICIYQMDVFKVTQAIFGALFDAIWDRGSFSAIQFKEENRGRRYVDIVSSLLRPNGRIMIANRIWYEDPKPSVGLCSHVPEFALKELFGKSFDFTQLDVDESKLGESDRYERVYNLMRMKTK